MDWQILILAGPIGCPNAGSLRRIMVLIDAKCDEMNITLAVSYRTTNEFNKCSHNQELHQSWTSVPP